MSTTKVQMPKGARDFLEQAEQIIERDPTDLEKVQIIDEKIEPLEAELEEIEDREMELRAAVREAENRVQSLTSELEEARVEVLTDDAPEEAVESIEDRLDDAEADLQSAKKSLDGFRSAKSQRKRTVKDALDRLYDRREEALREAKVRLLEEAQEVIGSLRTLTAAQLAKGLELARAASRVESWINRRTKGDGWGMKELPGGGRRRPETFIPSVPSSVLLEHEGDVEQIIESEGFELVPFGER
jgi:chromosome segregation ATPase